MNSGLRLAIVGATGMLGHHAAEAAIAAGHELTVVHRATTSLDRLMRLRFRAAVADLNDRESLRRALANADAVINCAGYYPTVPRAWREDVRLGLAQMENFYRGCEGLDLKKIVYVGAAIALRRHPRGDPGDETLEYAGEPENKNPYLQVKWAMDHQARAYASAGMPVVIGIPSMTFGEYDHGPTTGRLIVEVAKGTLPGYVRGKRNVIYAGDAGRGLVRVCESGRTGERYLLTGANITTDDLVATISRIAGRPMPNAIPLPVAMVVSQLETWRYQFLRGPLPKVDATAIAVMSAGQFLSGAKAEEGLGFKSTAGVEEAISRALSWFKQAGYV